MHFELDMLRYNTQFGSYAVPPIAAGAVTVSPNSSYNGNSPSQQGLLLMYTNGLSGREADIVTVTP
ncbi:MAG: hypothetical protein JOZ62_06620 [Acidobacteriaceae bacterium]|nr:hypothetical protein [Acidobacteriaceae bacterium]